MERIYQLRGMSKGNITQFLEEIEHLDSFSNQKYDSSRRELSVVTNLKKNEALNELKIHLATIKENAIIVEKDMFIHTSFVISGPLDDELKKKIVLELIADLHIDDAGFIDNIINISSSPNFDAYELLAKKLQNENHQLSLSEDTFLKQTSFLIEGKFDKKEISNILSGLDRVSEYKITGSIIEVTYQGRLAIKSYLSDALMNKDILLHQFIVNEKKDDNSSLIVSIIIGVILFMVGLYFNETSGLAYFFFVASYIGVGNNVLFRAISNIKKYQIFDDVFLISIATIGAILLGQAMEASLIMMVYQIGIYIQYYSRKKTEKSNVNFMNIKIRKANVEKGEELIEVYAEEVKLNDIIVVKPGEVIPVDGIVISGSTAVDTKDLLGNKDYLLIHPNDHVFAGYLNVYGLIKIKAVTNLENSFIMKASKRIKKLNRTKNTIEKIIEHFISIYTPLVIISSLGIALLPVMMVDGELMYWIKRALTYLVIACPCALTFGVSLGMLVGNMMLSKNRALVKDGNCITMLRKIRTYYINKDCLIIENEYSIEKSISLSNVDIDQIVTYFGMFSNFKPIKSLAKKFDYPLDKSKITNITDYPDLGSSGVLDNELYYVGSYELMDKINVDCPTSNMKCLYVASTKELLGYILFEEELKPDSLKTIRELKRSGYDLKLINKSNSSVLSLANTLDIKDYYDSVDETDLKNLMLEKRTKKEIAYVSNSWSDSEVLAFATLGIFLGPISSQSDIDYADLVITDDSPSTLIEAIHRANETLMIIKRNFIFAIIVKVICLVLGFFGILEMIYGVAIDIVVILITSAGITGLLSKSSKEKNSK